MINFTKMSKSPYSYRFTNESSNSVSASEIASIHNQETNLQYKHCPQCGNTGHAIFISSKMPVMEKHYQHGIHRGRVCAVTFACGNDHSWIENVYSWYSCKQCELDLVVNRVMTKMRNNEDNRFHKFRKDHVPQTDLLASIMQLAKEVSEIKEDIKQLKKRWVL